MINHSCYLEVFKSLLIPISDVIENLTDFIYQKSSSKS